MLYCLCPLSGLYISSQWRPIYENQPTTTYPIPQPSHSIAPFPALFTVAHQCNVSQEKAGFYTLHVHQASRACDPGVIHVQVISSSRLNMNPFSLAAKNLSSRIVTVSSPCPPKADSHGGTAMKVRASFTARGGADEAAASLGQWNNCSKRIRISQRDASR